MRLFHFSPAIFAGFLIAAGLFSTSAAATVVTPGGGVWIPFQETSGGAADTFGFVTGPGTPPAGNGSFGVSFDDAGDGIGIGAGLFQGTRLADLTQLSFDAYRASGGTALAFALQFNIDYDLTDATTGWQGRLVFEASNNLGVGANAGSILTGAWQGWDALAGGAARWWATGGAGIASCPIGAPCSLTDILGLFPNIGVHATLGAVLFKAGSGWTGGFAGNVDNFTLATAQTTSNFDFEGAAVAVPEPGGLSLLGFGLLGALALNRRRRGRK